MMAKKVVLAIAAALAVLMIMFPPVIKFEGEEEIYAYRFILTIPDGYHLHGPILLIEWFGLLLITGLLLPFFNKK